MNFIDFILINLSIIIGISINHYYKYYCNSIKKAIKKLDELSRIHDFNKFIKFIEDNNEVINCRYIRNMIYEYKKFDIKQRYTYLMYLFQKNYISYNPNWRYQFETKTDKLWFVKAICMLKNDGIDNVNSVYDIDYIANGDKDFDIYKYIWANESNKKILITYNLNNKETLKLFLSKESNIVIKYFLEELIKKSSTNEWTSI